MYIFLVHELKSHFILLYMEFEHHLGSDCWCSWSFWLYKYNCKYNYYLPLSLSIIFPVSLHCTYPIKPEERPKENTRKHDVNILTPGGDFIKHMVYFLYVKKTPYWVNFLVICLKPSNKCCDLCSFFFGFFLFRTQTFFWMCSNSILQFCTLAVEWPLE